MKAKRLMIAITLFTSSIAFCQVTTKNVKISTLTKIAKDLEKCKHTNKALDETRTVLDSIINQSTGMLLELENQRIERLKLNSELEEINKRHLKLIKKTKNSWVLPTAIGVIGGVVLGVSL